MNLEPDIFWGLTPREFSALRRVWEQGRSYNLSLYAGLQTTLHNAWFKREDGGRFQIEDFMPGTKRPRLTQTWQQQKMLLGAFFTSLKDLAKGKRDA